MKTFLRWLFEGRMQALEEQTEEMNFRLWEREDWNARKATFAENKLKQMGYTIKYESGVHEQPSELMHWEKLGFSIEKIEK